MLGKLMAYLSRLITENFTGWIRVHFHKGVIHDVETFKTQKGSDID